MNEVKNEILNQSASIQTQNITSVVNPLRMSPKTKDSKSNPLGLVKGFDLKDRITQIVLAIIVLFIVGIIISNIFGKDKLVCSSEQFEYDEGIEAYTTYEFTYKEGKITSGKQINTFILSDDESEENLTDLEEEFKSLNKYDDNSTTIKRVDNKLITTLNFQSEAIEIYNEYSKDELKETLEDSGMTCK